MAALLTAPEAISANGYAGSGDAPPSARKRMRLDTAWRVRREMGRLYLEARSGTLDVGDASKLANILALIGRQIEGADFETRIAALEQREKAKWS